MKLILLFLLVSIFLCYRSPVLLSDVSFFFNDAFRPFNSESAVMKTARQNFYPVEEHSVNTEDGYILKLFRIPSSPVARCRRPLPVVLHHGLFWSSDSWMIKGPRKALAYVLADSGYDVWMGNARGNTYSRKHENLSPYSYQFWQFSLDEIAIYDNAAITDYILSTTGQSQLHYVGYSQGSTIFFMWMSLFPEYNKKIKTMHAFAPVVFGKNHKSPVFAVVAKCTEAITLLAHYGIVEILPSSLLFQAIAGLLCRPPYTSLCYAVIRSVGGQSSMQETDDIFPQILQVFPAGGSVHQLIQILQAIQYGRIRFYDFGVEQNIKRYGSAKPPDYPLQNITASAVFLYISQGDTSVHPSDIEELIFSLPKQPTVVEVEDKHFGHLDYICGKYAKEMIYDRLLNEMETADGDICN